MALLFASPDMSSDEIKHAHNDKMSVSKGKACAFGPVVDRVLFLLAAAIHQQKETTCQCLN
jgi:hypothetical protein